MFCPYCGAANPDDAAFCRSCRRTIEAPPGGAATQQPPPPQEPWRTPYYDQAPRQAPYYTYAAFWPRAGAYILDLLFATLIAAIPGVLLAIALGLAVDASHEELPFWDVAGRAEQEDELALAIVGGFLLGYVPLYVAYFTIANAKGGGWGKRSWGCAS